MGEYSILDNDIISFHILKSIPIFELYQIYFNDKCDLDTKMYYLCGKTCDIIRHMLKDPHTIRGLCLEYNLNYNSSRCDTFSSFLDIFDVKYFFTEYASTEYRMVRYKSTLRLCRVLKLAGRIEDYKLIDYILDKEYLWCSRMHLTALGKGLGLSKMGPYLIKYHLSCCDDKLSNMDLLYSHVIDHMLKKGIDIEQKYVKYFDKRDDPSTMLKIIGNEHWHLLKYINVDVFIEEGLSIKCAAAYVNNFKLFLDQSNLPDDPILNRLKGIECGRGTLIGWCMSRDRLAISQYLQVTGEEILNYYEESNPLGYLQYKMLNAFFSREEIQNYIETSEYSIDPKILYSLIEDGYKITPNCYKNIMSEHFIMDIIELVPTVITTGDCKYYIFEMFDNNSYYDPYELRLLVSRLNIQDINELKHEIKQYIRHDYCMLEWFKTL